MNILIATIREWNIHNANIFKGRYAEWNVKLIFNKDDLTIEEVRRFKPDFIMFPHWSYYIPKDIYENYKCIVFHPSELPYGRGGSPVQNLIKMGIEKTYISAISVVADMDAGDIYLKRELSLLGRGEEIFIRMSKIVFFDMIPAIIENNIIPIPQSGEIVEFKRRKPDQSVLPVQGELGALFDHIRMLDADGYPKAFIEYGDFRLEFTRASLNIDGINADVKIVKKNMLGD